MSTKNNGGPAFRNCSRCDLTAIRLQGHQWLCAMHYRFGQMRASAKRHGKIVPTHDDLHKMLREGNLCEDCKSPMNWMAIDNQSLVATLQHYRDGSLAIVCRSCNTRHAFMLNDTFRNLPRAHKYCPHCKVAKSYDQFSADNGRSGPMKLKSWCKECSSLAHAKWKASSARAMLEARQQ